MTTVFVSYRRQDSADICDRITNHLEWRYGKPRIFRDVTTILAGSDFSQDIHQALQACRVMLVLIGPTWTMIQGADGLRRLDDPQDYVRLEVATALREHRLVVPVLVRGARAPHPSELPPDIADLAQRQLFIVRGDPYFLSDMGAIYRAIDGLARQRVGHWMVLATGILFSVCYLLSMLLNFLKSPFATTSALLAILAVLLAFPLGLIRVFSTGQWRWLPVVLAIPLACAGGVLFQAGLPRFPISYIVGFITCGALQVVFGSFGPSAPRSNLAPLSPQARMTAGRRIIGFTTCSAATFALVCGLLVALLRNPRLDSSNDSLRALIGLGLLITVGTLLVAGVQAMARTRRTRETAWLALFSILIGVGYLPGVALVLIVRRGAWAVGGVPLFIFSGLALMVALLIYGVRSWRRGVREARMLRTPVIAR